MMVGDLEKRNWVAPLAFYKRFGTLYIWMPNDHDGNLSFTFRGSNSYHRAAANHISNMTKEDFKYAGVTHLYSTSEIRAFADLKANDTIYYEDVYDVVGFNTEDKIFIDNDLGNWYEVYDLLNELNIYAMPPVETLLDKYGSAQ